MSPCVKRCPRCIKGGYAQDIALDGRPRFTCSRCGHYWTCGKDGREYELYHVSFGDVARGRLNQQCQYASRYLDPKNDPYFGEGIRLLNNDSGDYHSIRIHKDDVEIFVSRVLEWRKERDK